MSYIVTFQLDTFLASEIVAIEYFPPEEDDKSVQIDITLRGFDRGEFVYEFKEDDPQYEQARALYLQLVEDWKRTL